MTEPVPPARNVGRRGEDVGIGSVVLHAGRLLRPQDVGVLASIGASLPRRLPGLLASARASAATLHYSVASPAAIRRAHDVGAAVYVWTVDDPGAAQTLIDAGADGIITNDPRIFGSLRA